MGEQYTIEDFLDGKIYVQCDNEEERQVLKDLSGWNGREDAFTKTYPNALYRHARLKGGYGHTVFSDIGEPYFKDVPIVPVGALEEATIWDVQFDNSLFLAMLGCGGE